jgi:hypothetical protein
MDKKIRKTKESSLLSSSSLRIFMPNGIPDILKVIEKSNWKGQMLLV